MFSEYDGVAIAEKIEDWFKANIYSQYVSENGWVPEMTWVDVETTGLTPDEFVLIELGIIVTDKYGHPGPNSTFSSIIKPDLPINWESVSAYVQEMHNRSHLAKDIAEAEGIEAFSLSAVQSAAIEFLREQFGENVGGLNAAGSSVHFDKMWLEARMPELNKLFSHRIVDVSSVRIIKELRHPKAPDSAYQHMGAHRVIPDLIDSIEEYRYLLKVLEGK